MIRDINEFKTHYVGGGASYDLGRSKYSTYDVYHIEVDRDEAESVVRWLLDDLLAEPGKQKFYLTFYNLVAEEKVPE